MLAPSTAKHPETDPTISERDLKEVTFTSRAMPRRSLTLFQNVCPPDPVLQVVQKALTNIKLTASKDLDESSEERVDKVLFGFLKLLHH